MTESLRIIFMGTPDFAVPSLQILCDHGYDVIAVITSPDRPSGRGLKIQSSPVKLFANSRNIPVLQPDKLKAPEFLDQLRSLRADLQVVVAFRMLPEVVWNMPRLGTLNLHASLLPDYRGAAPINHALIQGESVTGVTTFFLKHEIDTGDILQQQSVNISPDDTAGSLHDRLMNTGADLLLNTVKNIANGEVSAIPQKGTGIKKAPKIFKEDCKINWANKVEEIRNFIRGLSPYPSAWTPYRDKQMKIFACHIEVNTDIPPPGSIETDGKKFLRISAKDGWIYIDDLQWQGKKRMDVHSFLRGIRP